MCFKCLTTGHIARDCNTTVECSKCKRDHLDVLHPEGPITPTYSGQGTTYSGNRNPFTPSRGNGYRNGGGYGYNNRGTYRGNNNNNYTPAYSNTSNAPANSSNTNNAPTNNNSNSATTGNIIGNQSEANISSVV